MPERHSDTGSGIVGHCGMRLVLSLPLAPVVSTFRDLVGAAQQMEEAGVDDLTVGDYLVMSASSVRTLPGPLDRPIPDALATLAAVASGTERIGLGTGVLNAALRPAALLAKAATTVDHLSDGRLWFCVSRGWLPEEYAALGVDFERREEILDDTVEACRVLWRDSPATFSSPTVSFQDVYCAPLPVQPGGPPIYYAGGLHEGTVDRLVAHADGWFPYSGMGRDDLEQGFGEVREALAAAGRDPATFTFLSGVEGWAGSDLTAPPGSEPVGEVLDRALPAMAEAGVSMAMVAWQRYLTHPDGFGPLLDEIVDRFATHR